MPGRRSGCSVPVNGSISKPWPLPPSCRPIHRGPSACWSPPLSPLPSQARAHCSREDPGSRGEHGGDLCCPQARKRTKETQTSRALRFPPNSSASRSALAAAAASPRSSESPSETPQQTDGAGPGGQGVFARGGRRQRQVKIRLPSELQREVCDWRPLPHAGRRRRPPDAPAEAPGHARGSPERSNPFWACGAR